MNQKEWESWKRVTASSTHRWVEDSIFYSSGRGAMYYTGGESGVYMKITKDGTFELGTYEGALPHIGEAFYTVELQKQCTDYNEAFQMACQLGGKKFLMDMFTADQISQEVVRTGQEQKQEHNYIMSL